MAILTSGGDDPTDRKKPRRMRPVKTSPTLRKQYTAALTAQADLLRAASANLSDLVRSNASRAQVSRRLIELMDVTQAEIDRTAPVVAGTFTSAADRQNKAATEENLRRAMGVNYAAIMDESPQVAAAVNAATAENVGLISSIPSQHWAKVGQAVIENYAGSADPTSLTARIQQIGGVTLRRARLIARDQTSKLTGSINSARQQSVGIQEYVWRTSKDQRVVGNPNGLYPEGNSRHHNHWEREGKVYRWDSPPEGGHPGEEIQCRCYAEPVLNFETLKVRHV